MEGGEKMSKIQGTYYMVRGAQTIVLYKQRGMAEAMADDHTTQAKKVKVTIRGVREVE